MLLFEIYDLAGRVVFWKELELVAAVQTLDLPTLPLGGYFWAVNGVPQGKLVKM